MILEADLDDLVGEAEHYGMLGAHPLLHVDNGLGFPAHVRTSVSAAALFFHLNIAINVS